MSRRSIISAVLAPLMLYLAAFSQDKQDSKDDTQREPVNTTVCKAMKAGKRLDGKMVRLEAELAVGYHGAKLVSDDCNEGIELLFWSDEPAADPSVIVVPIQDENWRRLRCAIEVSVPTYIVDEDEAKIPSEKCRDFEGRQFDVKATLIGRFDYGALSDVNLQQIRPQTFGAVGGPGRLVLERVFLVELQERRTK